MSAASSDDGRSAEPPLWSIGLAVLVILLAPLILYSWAPSGPLREGDTVFSDGEQRVAIRQEPGIFHAQPGERCLLDPGNPLIVIQPPGDRQDGLLLAQVQGNPSRESPFCRPQTHVFLTANQIFQKPELFKNALDSVRGWFAEQQR